MKKNIFILLFCGLFSSSTLAFEFNNFNGSSSKLENHLGKGKWTLLMLWAHDCGVCRAEFPSISDFHQTRKDVEVIGLSIDGEDKKDLAQSFLDSTKSSFTNYITSLSVVAANYNVLTQENFRGTPTFLLFSPDGELIGNNPGKLSIEALESFIDKNS